MFLRLQVEAQKEPFQNLVAYIRRQWIESAVFLSKKLERVPAGHQNEQRHRGMAQRSESSGERAVRITSVLLNRAPGQRGETYSRHHQDCVR